MTVRTSVVLAAIACGLVAAPVARAAMSVDTYLLIESGAAKVDPDYTYVYVSGVLDALTTFNEAVRGAGVSLFCPPDDDHVIDVDAFKGQIDQVIADAKRTRADFDQFARAASIGIIGLRVLNEALPCADQPPGAGAADAPPR